MMHRLILPRGKWEPASCLSLRLRDWRDVMKHYFSPGWVSDTRQWPNDPSNYREVIVGYQKETSSWARKSCKCWRKLWVLEQDYFVEYHDFSRSLSNINFNYYLPCPQANLSLGITSHSDPGSINLLLADPDVPGLQVKKNGHWVTVEPVPHGLIINVGDALQVGETDARSLPFASF